MEKVKLIKTEHSMDYVIIAINKDELDEIKKYVENTKSLRILDTKEGKIALNVDLNKFKGFKNSDFFRLHKSKNHSEYYIYTYSVVADKRKYKELKERIKESLGTFYNLNYYEEDGLLKLEVTFELLAGHIMVKGKIERGISSLINKILMELNNKG